MIFTTAEAGPEFKRVFRSVEGLKAVDNTAAKLDTLLQRRIVVAGRRAQREGSPIEIVRMLPDGTGLILNTFTEDAEDMLPISAKDFREVMGGVLDPGSFDNTIAALSTGASTATLVWRSEIRRANNGLPRTSAMIRTSHPDGEYLSIDRSKGWFRK